MEHIVQFGVSLDDEAIKREIVKQASEVVIHEIKDEIKTAIYGRHFERGIPLDYMGEKVTEFLEKHKDEIINEAAETLADKLSRTKAAKEAAAKAICEKTKN